MNRLTTATVLSLLLAMPGSASAATLMTKDELQLSVGSLVRLGYLAEFTDADSDQRPFFQFARLSAGVAHERFGRAFVQVEAAGETAGLLDAFVELGTADLLRGRIGVFRLPTTADFYVGAADILFSNRSLLVTMTQPRLAGAELESTFGPESARINARVGFFQPTSQSRELLPDQDGNFASMRLGVDFAFGLGLHVAYLQLLLADNDLVVVGVDEPIEVRPVPYPQVIDAALTFKRGPWNATLEGLLAPDPGDGPMNSAAYAQAGYRFELSEDIGLTPAARVGMQRVADVSTTRVTVGTTLALGSNLKVLPNYELRILPDTTEHLAILTLQGGF